MNNSGCFLTSRNDGLGARLTPILSAMRLGAAADVKVRIHWPVIAGMDHNTSEYRDLFSAGFIADHFIDAAAYNRLNAGAAAIETALDHTPAGLREAVDAGEVFIFANPTRGVKLETETAAAFDDGYRHAFSRIGFSPAVRERIDAIDRAFAGRRLTAYHVRHGDLTRHYRTRGKPWPAKYVPNEFYRAHLDATPPTKGAVRIVFGDCAQSLAWLREHCRSLVTIDDIVPLDGLGSLQRDFLELYAMSRATRIVAPRLSGFSLTAAAIGRAQVADIMDELDAARKAEAFEALRLRIETDRESFTNDGDVAQSLAHLVPHLESTNRPDTARRLIEGEIARGNTVPFLFRLDADLALAGRDRTRMRALSRNCRDAMIYERGVIAEIDAMAARLDIAEGDCDSAAAALRRGAFLAPLGRQMQIATTAFIDAPQADLETFFPVDPELLRLPFLTNGRTPGGKPAIDMRLLAWEVRAFLFGTLLRPLTGGGLARKALTALERAKDALGPDGGELVVSLQSFRTLIEMETGDPGAALAASAALAVAHPGHRMARQRFVLNLRAMGKNAEAREHAAELLAMAPDNPCYNGLMGDLLFEAGLRDDALDHYQKANPGRADFAVFVTRQAALLRRHEREDEADRLLESALAATGWLDRFILDHARARLRRENPADLLPRLQKLAREGGSLRRVHDLIARVKLREGKPDEALGYARQAVEHHPGDLDACLLLIDLLIRSGDDKEARRRLDALADLTGWRISEAARLRALLDPAPQTAPSVPAK